MVQLDIFFLPELLALKSELLAHILLNETG